MLQTIKKIVSRPRDPFAVYGSLLLNRDLPIADKPPKMINANKIKKV